MRRMEKEFLKKAAKYEKELQKFGILENEIQRVSISDRRSQSTNRYSFFDTVGGYYTLCLDYDRLEILGLVEITMYHNGTFGISVEGVPIYVNDFYSMQALITIFYGTPFDLQIERIRSVDFVRYAISLSEIKTNDFSKFLVYIRLLNECLHQVHEKVVYD